MLSPAIPYLMVLACWIVYFHWSDINQTLLSLYLLVFAVPLVKLNVNLVVSRPCDRWLYWSFTSSSLFACIGSLLYRKWTYIWFNYYSTIYCCWQCTAGIFNSRSFIIATANGNKCCKHSTLRVNDVCVCVVL